MSLGVRLDPEHAGFWAQTETSLSSVVFIDLVFASGSSLTLAFGICALDRPACIPCQCIWPVLDQMHCYVPGSVHGAKLSYYRGGQLEIHSAWGN